MVNVMNVNDDVKLFCDDLLEELNVALENGKISKDEYDRLVNRTLKHRTNMLNEVPNPSSGKLLLD